MTLTSNALSDAFLCGIALFAYQYLTKNSPFKIYWACFLLPIAAAAFLGTLRFLGFSAVNGVHYFTQIFAGSFGILFLLVAILGEVFAKNFKPIPFAVVGFLLYLLFGYTEAATYSPVFTSFAMLIAICMATWGVFKRHNRCLWILLGILPLALNTKLNHSFDPMDSYHFALAWAILCFGKFASMKKEAFY